jgi:hypothetical protein
MILYALIAEILMIVLTIRFITTADVAPRSKWFLGAFARASLSIWWFAPTLRLLTTLLQIAVSVYLIIYQIAVSKSGPSEPL